MLPDAGATARAGSRAVATAPPEARPRILLADDNADMRDYVCRLLEGRYRVTAVRNGAEALRAAREARPDLVLSDVMMPVMDGIELVQRLRADDALRTLPVILLSARAGEEATASGLELGADDYLTKPFSAKELLARVHSQLSMAALRLRTAELSALLGARDEFLSIASHELKTPITSLRMQLQMTERSTRSESGRASSPERLAKALRTSLIQVDRLTSLVEELLDVARIRSGHLQLDFVPVDLVPLARDTLERLSGQLAQAGCQVQFDAPPSLFGVWDARRLEQVLTNLTSNAMKYAPGVPLEVRLSEAGEERIRLEVRDFGPGVPQAQRDTIFDRFDRGSASRNAGGLGLGLFISRQIVSAHGGSITVEGPPGGGARFVIVLPRDAVGSHAGGLAEAPGAPS